MAAAIIYTLCALTSITCFVLLWRSYRASRARLLFWSALCFACLSVNNVLLVLDRLVWPVEVDLGTWRLSWALAAVLLLLFGLIWGGGLMQQMLMGAIAMGWLLAGLFFFRFWRQTRDRFFLCFAISFWLESANRVALALLNDMQEDNPVFYGVRVVAYGLILLAIWQKNRPRR